ncbi:hypothetical protein [Lysinibacillus parviboronicapiens]|uniref:Uncharacterized protein n=1 Tax=Lysinibacillus parviboronicapiens TaxID=436516 RepID=A0ABV2PGJ2_9BACI|nr:hypothetical protein [Lysinibacillus parviboronicapiens]
METVFRNGLMEKEVKLCLYSVNLLAKGEVCPFLSKFHIENSYRSTLPS